MATGLQVKNITQIIKGGYPHEYKGIRDGGYNNWTDVPLSGSVEVKYFYSDSQYMDNARRTTVFVTVQDTWSASIEPTTNEITLTVTSVLKRVDRSEKVGDPGSMNLHMRAWPDQTKAQLLFDAVQNCCCTGVALSNPVTLDTVTLHLPANTENGSGTVFYRSNVQGYDDSSDETYVDEFYMGSQFRNVLPDKPVSPTLGTPTFTAVNCQTVNASIPVTQNSWGNYTTETTYARYKIGASGTWSNWQQVTTAHTGTYLITGLNPSTTVYVEVYTTGDSTTSDTASSTITTPSRPQTPTLAFVSQVAEENQTTLDATIRFTQSDRSSFGTTSGYARYKVGDDDYSEWFSIGSNYTTKQFHITGLLPDRAITVQSYCTGDGLCCATNATMTFNTPKPPEPPVHGNFAQTDTGSAINVTMPWTQPDNARFTTGDTYWAWHIDNGAWTDWTTASDWTAGTDSIQSVPYGSTLCVRSYSVGDGLRSEATETCVTVSEAVVDDTPYQGDPFVMVTLCNNLLYLVELICQEWYAIKDGDRIVYTNEEHKQHCDGDPDDPTLHSILSRIYRYFGAILCLICDGLNDSFNHHKRGPENTVLTGNGDNSYGSWEEIDTEVTEDSTMPVTSDAVWRIIDEFIHTVYHYVGDWDYLTLNPTTLSEVLDPRDGDTALVKNGADGTNQNYTYTNGSWVAGSLEPLEDFNLIHVNKKSDWTYGGQSIEIPANSGWYWYNNNWNRLDASAGEIQQELDELLATNVVKRQDENEEYFEVAVVHRNSDGTVPINVRPANKTVYFVTEEI